ncbi:T9SS type A sorting domain-containing protein [Winogradskyella sp. A2]|uniref:T9SS type A sorting domain-containing protein n=1 Tax=Winogradskyella sp. A2 TaxID=3366944 RepID=UPI00398C6990
MKIKLPSSLLFFLTCLITFSQNSLETTFTGGNSGNGAIFDIVALNDVTIESFGVSVASQVTSGTMEIYYKEGTFVGFTSDPNAWTLLTTITNISSSGDNVETPLNLDLNQEIPAGTTGAFWITFNDGSNLRYTNAASSDVGNVFSEDSNIQFLLGSGSIGGFGGLVFNGRIFNGVINYSEGLLNINEYENRLNLALSPNPSDRRISIKNIEIDEIDRVLIYDFTGKVVREIESKYLTNLTIDVSKLPAGMYLLKVQGFNGQEAVKTLIKK